MEIISNSSSEPSETDIKLVMTQTKVSREQAIIALKLNKYENLSFDVILAINAIKKVINDSEEEDNI